MNNLRTWNFEDHEVRTVEIDGEPWFVLSDVCKVLELSSPHKVADRLDGDERNQIPVIDSLGRHQNTTVVNESGLYTVVLRSDKPQAKPFRKWVTLEVLPSIRKTGSYSTQSQFADLSPQLQFLIQMEIRQNKLEEEQKKQNQALERMKETGADESLIDWYINLRRFGGCVHSGFGMGFERLIMYLTGIENIRDVIPYPRTPGNCLY